MTGLVDVTASTLREWPLPEPASSDKYSRGVALVVGGSAGTPGAVRLAGEAALRAGCGKLRLATVAAGTAHLGVLVPEARVFTLEDAALAADQADAMLIGPGLVDPAKATTLVESLVPALEGPVVLDALATAYVTAHPDLAGVSGPAVLTMNPAEVAEVLGVSPDEVDDDPVATVRRLVESSGAVVLLGGSVKVVGTLDSTFRVTAGGPGLATSGSGDVQAGLVTGLLARGAPPAQAAVWGAWLHAAAGDRIAARTGRLGFLARELSAEVPALLDSVAAD